MNDCTYCGSISTYKRGCKPCAKSYNKIYNERNADKLKQKRQKWRDTHKSEKAITDHNWYLKNSEKKRAYQNEFRETHKDYYKEIRQKYYLNNKEKEFALMKQWRKDNPEQFNEISNRYVHQRRTLKMNCEGSHTREEWKLKLKEHPFCALCKRNDVKLTKDHIIPLCKKGTNYITNLQPLCKSCNCKKSSRILTEEEILNWSNSNVT